MRQSEPVSTSPDNARLQRLVLAVLAGTALLLAFWWWLGQPPAPGAGRVLQTATAEQRIERLEDGSELQLQPDTRAVITFSAAQRLVQLEQGEIQLIAEADVRPLSVVIPPVQIRADNSVLKVTLDAGFLQLQVRQGSVTVQHPSGPQTLMGGDTLRLVVP